MILAVQSHLNIQHWIRYSFNHFVLLSLDCIISGKHLSPPGNILINSTLNVFKHYFKMKHICRLAKSSVYNPHWIKWSGIALYNDEFRSNYLNSWLHSESISLRRHHVYRRNDDWILAFQLIPAINSKRLRADGIYP